MKASEQVDALFSVFDDATRQGEIHDLAKRIEKMENFIRDMAVNYDCDTGANGCHPSYCRQCNAKKIIEENQ
jgi:hypothetical protein